MRIADLSIDFDFFVRENPMWDFGHGETAAHLSDWLWGVRYGSVDLHTETDIARYADFLPAQLAQEFRARGFDWTRRSGSRRLGLADSHQHAFRFFRDGGKAPDMFISLDAHHDLWPLRSGSPRTVLAENWMVHLYDAWQKKGTQFHMVYPKWKDPELDGPPERHVHMQQWADFPKFDDVIIRHVFLCRSGGWVPPHHDTDFIELGGMLYEMSRYRYVLDTLQKRMDLTTSDAAILRAHRREEHARVSALLGI